MWRYKEKMIMIDIGWVMIVLASVLWLVGLVKALSPKNYEKN
jgi:hypothetical protein